MSDTVTRTIVKVHPDGAGTLKDRTRAIGKFRVGG